MNNTEKLTGKEAFDIIFEDLICLSDLGLSLEERKLFYDATDKIEEDFEKLDQLKDIENNKLGVDLITLFKALTTGIWYKDENNEVNQFIPSYMHTILLDDGGTGHDWTLNLCYAAIKEYDILYRVLVKDYGKTWALTKEELELNNTEVTIDKNAGTEAAPNNVYINFDSVDDVTVRINNNEIKVDKNKLEALLKSFALTKED